MVISGKILNFATEPRDAWCLRGGAIPGIGWFVYIRKGVYLRFISWLLENLAIFETIVKSEAMVDAPGRFMYFLFTT